MITYHKIETIFKRDEQGTKRLIPYEWRDETVEFLRDCEWVWTEKIDGTNIGIYWDGHAVHFQGRKERAMRKKCTLEWVDDNGNVIPNGITPIKAEPYKSAEQNVENVPIGDTISRAEAIEVVGNLMADDEIEMYTYYIVEKALKTLPSADRPKVIRSKTLMPTKDFKEWAKRIREVNPNAMIIPCDAEVVSADRPKGDPETEPAPVVAYICDRRRCAICSGPDGGCDHTTDIKHAAHFKNVAGQYFERPYMEEEDDGKDNDQG